MLKMTKVELEKISNLDIHLFIEKGMRGGISYIKKRYSKANNEFCPNYDKKTQKNYIIYLDMNNLYGDAMSECLPYGKFKWVKVNNEVVNRILNKKDDSLHGYFLEVDLEISEELHDYHKGYSMAPEKIQIEDYMLSPYQLKIKNKYDIKSEGINKLVPNLLPKKNYVVHYRNLKYYLSKGWILTKVHKILEFKQSDWMKSYIDFNTQRRKEATNEADKTLFKLLNNVVYGKTIENMRKRIKIRTTTNEKDFLKYYLRPTYVGHKKIGKNLVIIHEKKELLILNKPIYVGNTVLELSKLTMYKFYYDFVNKKCKCVLLFTDTDSLFIETEEDFYKIMHESKEYFDLSNFPKNSKYHSNGNKKVPGKMKDEYGGVIILELAGTKSKMYSIRDIKNYEKSTHKGHNSYIKYDEFKDTLFNKKIIRHNMSGMKSINHITYTYEPNKTSLSCYDDKRYILDDEINTLPYGHEDIQNNI